MFIDRIFYLDPALVAGVIVVALKVIFGRSWPELAYERAGTDEFRWFAGEWTRQRGAFPSATACITTAVATSLWRRSSSMRWPPVVIAAVSTVLVVVQEYHWLSDAIAGVLLGVAIGRRTSRELS